MIKTAFVVLVLLTPTVVARAQEHRTAPRLTLQERLELRVDPAHVIARSHRNALKLGVDSKSPAVFIIDGSENPEVFLPSEVFSMLIGALDGESPRSDSRRIYDPALASLGWKPDTFWSDLALIVGPYRLLASQGGKERTDLVSRQICGARVAALNEMRMKYPALDDFLYASVAPRFTIVSSEIAPAERLAWIEGGCK
jgi:hypothetical protein